MRKDVLAALACAGAMTCAGEAEAATYAINNFPITQDSRTPSGGIAAVGEDASFEGGVSGFYGQTFVAPSVGAVVANSLSFQMEWLGYGDGPFGPLKYRVLLVDAHDIASVNLDDVLFSTSELTLPMGSGWTAVNIDLGSTLVSGGQTYAWVIDGYSDRNDTTGLAEVGTANDFADGNLVYGGYFANPGIPLSQVVLSEFGEGIDLAFRMEFASVPEPASWTMMLLGFFGLGAMLRRRGEVTA